VALEESGKTSRRTISQKESGGKQGKIGRMRELTKESVIEPAEAGVDPTVPPVQNANLLLVLGDVLLLLIHQFHEPRIVLLALCLLLNAELLH
jgi:hypothetical protein